MAFGDTIQSIDNTNSIAGAGTVNTTATFGATATSGNLLVANLGTSGAVSVWSATAGWTLLHDSGTTGNMGGSAYFRISDGTETAVTLSATVAGATNTRIAFAEFEGPFAGTPLDQSAEDATNVSTVVTSQPSGTTGTTSQNDELGIVFFMADGANNVDGGRSYSNSFTEVIFGSTTVSTGRPAAAIAKRVLSATGTFSSTYTTTDPGDEMYGVIATFKKLVAAGVTTKTLAALGVG